MPHRLVGQRMLAPSRKSIVTGRWGKRWVVVVQEVSPDGLYAKVAGGTAKTAWWVAVAKLARP